MLLIVDAIGFSVTHSLALYVRVTYSINHSLSHTHTHTHTCLQGVAAISAVPALGWLQMFFLIGSVDYYGYLGDFESGKPDLDPDELTKRQNSELTHGRLAMLATLELLRHDSQNMMQPGFDGLDNMITGLPFLYQ